MSDLSGNHIVGFPTREYISTILGTIYLLTFVFFVCLFVCYFCV